MQYIFLSHDVDWRRQGPPVKHILERKDRFDSEIFTNTKPENLYRNIPEYMDCLLYTSPSPRDVEETRMPSSA